MILTAIGIVLTIIMIYAEIDRQTSQDHDCRNVETEDECDARDQ